MSFNRHRKSKDKTPLMFEELPVQYEEMLRIDFMV
jgi:hypothetical protein